VNLKHSHEVSKTNLNHEWLNTQNLLDFPLNKTTNAYYYYYYFIYMQDVQWLAPLSFLIDPCNEC
jgi:hypothetical protein